MLNEYNKPEVGLRLQLARISKRYTQEYVAERCGIGKNQISGIERGILGVSVTRLIQLCALYEVSIDYILCGQSLNQKTQSPEKGILDDLPLAQQRNAIDIIRIFVESQQQMSDHSDPNPKE